MKRISGLGLAVATIVVLALADGAARAQDFTAGKTPAQLFASDCSACHRGTAGLAKGRDARTLSSFLREHYTTKPESAGALAAYVASGIGANAPLAGAPAGPAATAERPPTERRGRHDTTTAATEEGGGAKPAEDASARRRRTTNLSGDGEKPRSREGGEPRPPVAGSPEGARDGTRPARTVRGEEANRALRSGERADAPDPVEQLRAYLATGLSLEGTAAEAAKAGPPKPRARRDNPTASESTAAATSQSAPVTATAATPLPAAGAVVPAAAPAPAPPAPAAAQAPTAAPPAAAPPAAAAAAPAEAAPASPAAAAAPMPPAPLIR